MKRLLLEIRAYLLYPFIAMGLLLMSNAVYQLWKLNPLAGIVGVFVLVLYVLAYFFIMSPVSNQVTASTFAKRFCDYIVRGAQQALDRFSDALHNK